MTSNITQICTCVRFLILTHEMYVKVKMVTSQKRLMTSIKLNISQTMIIFQQVTSAKLKIGKLFLTVANSNFQELLFNEFDAK